MNDLDPTARPALVVDLPPSAAEWTVIDGLPGAWRRLRTRLAVTARAADGVVVDGQLVDGLQLLPIDPSTVELTVRGRRVELVDRGTEALVRVRCA